MDSTRVVSSASSRLKFSRRLRQVLYTAPVPRRHAGISARRARWSAPSAGRPGCPASLLRCCWTVMRQRATARSTAPARPGRTLTPACARECTSTGQLHPVSGYCCNNATLQCLCTSLSARTYQASVLKAGSTQRCTSGSTQRSASIQRPRQCALLIGRLPLEAALFLFAISNIARQWLD